MAKDYYSKRDKSLGITWFKLDQYICKKTQLCQIPLKQQEFMDKMFMRLPDSQSSTPKQGKLYIAAFAPKGDLSSSSIRKYSGYMYYAKDDSLSRFKNVRDYLIEQKNQSLESWDYKTHPDILAFKTIWEELIPSATSTDYNEPLEEAILAIINEIPLDNIPAKKLLITDRFSSLIVNHEYSLVLAILSVIASTLFCFGCGDEPLSEADYKLHALVLPPVPKRDESSELKKARKFVENKAGTLEELLQKMKLPLKNPAEQGDAYYLLAQYAYEINKNPNLTDKEHFEYNQKLTVT